MCFVIRYSNDVICSTLLFCCLFVCICNSFFDDEIEVGLKIKEVGNTSMTWIMGLFIKKTGELANACEVVHVYTDVKTGKPTTITEDLKKKLGII